jgi:hypothetical protein
MDPFAIVPLERSRFEQQFAALKPNNGIITGEQAKGFFLQSQLPPATLGVIWFVTDPFFIVLFMFLKNYKLFVFL